jgi:hypothetical protein
MRLHVSMDMSDSDSQGRSCNHLLARRRRHCEGVNKVSLVRVA